jgi:hypothetical protein
LFVLLHISHVQRGVKQTPGRLVESILIYRRNSSGSSAIFDAIRPRLIFGEQLGR